MSTEHLDDIEKALKVGRARSIKSEGWIYSNAEQALSALRAHPTPPPAVDRWEKDGPWNHMDAKTAEDMSEAVRKWREYQIWDVSVPGSSKSLGFLEKSEELMRQIADRKQPPAPPPDTREGQTAGLREILHPYIFNLALQFLNRDAALIRAERTLDRIVEKISVKAPAVASREGGADPCTWTEDEDGNFDTGCGRRFTWTDGGCKENGANFCLYCGKPLAEVKFKYPDDDEAPPPLGDGEGRGEG